MLTRLPFLALALGIALVGCAAGDADDSDGIDDDESATESTQEALTSTGGTATLYYLGSSAFLRRCAGNTLGCGDRVASISDATPYFSAPRTWPRNTCDDWYTFKYKNKCVEARREEVSDRRNYMEGNPGLMKGLGISHGDGRNCAGYGQAKVKITPGRHCG